MNLRNDRRDNMQANENTEMIIETTKSNYNKSLKSNSKK